MILVSGRTNSWVPNGLNLEQEILELPDLFVRGWIDLQEDLED